MKKIMFNDRYGLTQAVLEGRKTQTRRAIKLKNGEYVNVVALDNGSFMSYIAKDGKPTAYVGAIDMPNFVRVLAPKYFIGEEVDIAQNYSDVFHIVDENNRAIIDKINCTNKGWSNKMFVRADLMPHRIKITNIRLERLQDISDKDCLKEGIVEKPIGTAPAYWVLDVGFSNIRHAFRNFIDKICGPNTWHSNPYVFVYDFELVK